MTKRSIECISQALDRGIKIKKLFIPQETFSSSDFGDWTELVKKATDKKIDFWDEP